MAVGPVSQKFRNRSGWIIFDSFGNRNDARKMLLNKTFVRASVPLHLEEGEKGKAKRDWSWRASSLIGCFSLGSCLRCVFFLARQSTCPRFVNPLWLVRALADLASTSSRSTEPSIAPPAP